MKNKLRLNLLLMGVVGLCNVAFSQSVADGRKFLYYQRYKSAKDVFDKILASNPNNIEAIYWLGQTDLDMKDSVAAQELYSKALQTNGNAPLLLAGMGGVELRFGKLQDARTHFETAISLSKGKDVSVLNAIADNNIDARQGDAQYAIEKLTEATNVKHFDDPQTYVLMGDAYRKLIDGGNAVQAYQKALTMDPKLAEAEFKIGKIYETQNNKDYFLPAFEKAVEMDPAYAPAYYELYYYYYYHWDAAKAEENLNKYIANTDPGTDVDIAKIDFLYVSAKFAEAKAAALQMISAQGAKADPKLYKLVAYCCDTLGDNACAMQYMTNYFSKVTPDAIIPGDYEGKAKIETKSADSTVMNASFGDFEKAIQLDTLPSDKANFLAEATAFAKKINNKKAIAELAAITYMSKTNPTNADLYNWGAANYQAGNYQTADSIFCGIYETKYPDEVYGYLWCFRSKAQEDDSVGSQGIAVDAEMKLAAWGRAKDSAAAGTKDSALYKRYVVDCYSRLAFYYNNTKNDKQSAIFWLQQILAVDPTNADAKRYIEILSRPVRQPAKPKGEGRK